MQFQQNPQFSGVDLVETTSNSSANYFFPSVINGAINVVPEPRSVVLMLLGAIGLLRFGRPWTHRR